jgi:putative ABC transport system permease protein
LLIGVFALVAVLLAVLGLYGVLSHAVIQQRKEIGLRLALGATPGKVVAHILRDALFMVVVGLGLGLAGALALSRLLKGLLFQAPALDPVVLTTGCLAMGTISLLAAFVPANRAARLDPVNALREDG